MDRIEFMQKLEHLLQDIPESERMEAIKYYNDYFNDAGVENEDQIIEDLVSPEKVACIIKADLNGNAQENGEFTERGYEDQRFTENYEMTKNGEAAEDKTEKGYKWNAKDESFHKSEQSQNTSGQAYDRGRNQSSAGKILLIIVLCIFAIPVGIPLLAGAFGIIVGILAVIFGLGVSVVACAAALTFGGILAFGFGLAVLVELPFAGISICGIGLVLFGFGMLFIWLTVWLFGKAIPTVIRGIVYLCRLPFRRADERRSAV